MNTWGNGKIITWMGLGSIPGKMEGSIRVNIGTIRNTATASMFGVMVEFIRGNGLRVNSMDLDYTQCRSNRRGTVYGRMEDVLNGLTRNKLPRSKMGKLTTVNSLKNMRISCLQASLLPFMSRMIFSIVLAN